MLRNFLRLRAFGVALLTVGLSALIAVPSSGQAPGKDADPDTQITALEKQIADLQAKLKDLKEPRSPMPRVVAEPEVGLPAAWANKFQWRSIGPATMGGRITSIAVFEADPTTYWVASASGGLLKTTNNGMSFEHQFDRESTVSIGAVAVAPSNRDVVWVGTGEANPRNSVSYGDGVYKSTDGGKTWKNMGLKASYQVGDIVIHPTNPDIVYVGALGRLYGPGGERGLFKTEDGGKSWKNILPQAGDKAGVIDLAINPNNPEVLLVATWERQRDEFDSFLGEARRKVPGGSDAYAPETVHAPGSAIYKTTDGGKTFTRLTKGLPTARLGRIGFDWSRKTPNLVFAIVDTEKAGLGRKLGYAGFTSETEKDAVKVTALTPNTPAVKAGLKVGDLITAVGGKAVKTYEAMLAELARFTPGDKTKFSVTRGKDKLELEVTFGVRAEDRPLLGVSPGGEAAGGVRLESVAEVGPATAAGLKAGDILLSIDDHATKATADIGEALDKKSGGDKVKVTYLRGKEKNTAELTLEARGRPYGHPLLGGQSANVQNQQGDIGPETGGVFKSTDGGETWARINSINPRPFYFSVVRVDPTDDNVLYVLGVDLNRSTDGGKTFSASGINSGIHSDQHALWINPKDGRHLILGTDGGFYVSFDKAAKWDHMTHAGAIGQFYHVAVDNRTPYHVYGGLQDNGSWGGPSRSERWPGPLNSDWVTVTWGDGFVCRVDANDPDIVYTESQDGNIVRSDMRTGRSTSIRPQPAPGLQPYRFNWNTPFILSTHNASILYSAGNYVFRSVQRGNTLQAVSPEITRTKRGTGTALSESPRNADVVWAGTDDGAVWLTRDGCKTWTNLTEKFLAGPSPLLPGPRWVASIEASRYADGRCYIVFDAHRSNEEQPYVFMTEDFGQTWKSLRANLPVGPTRVLREDIANPNLLYLGTEFACYASIDRGNVWTKINGDKGLPTVAVHEFAQPTTANDLVVATHGRSIWVLDVTALRQMTPEVVKGQTSLLSPSPVVQWKRGNTPPFYESTRAFYGQNPARGANIDYVIGKKAEKATIKVLDVAGHTVREFPAATDPGYYRLNWDLARNAVSGAGRKGPNPKKGNNESPAQPTPNLNPLVRPNAPGQPAEFRIVLTVDGTELVQTLTIEPDPSLPRGGLSEGDGEEREEMEDPEREERELKKDD
jgi:photosystem II stability/assembly factor-like uncharacterized protein